MAEFSIKTIEYFTNISLFLSTLTIKSDWYISEQNRRVEEQGGYVDPDDPTSWKFYINIQGKYHPTDVQIYITTVETNEEILFDTENMAQWPKTKLAYKVGGLLYMDLVARYPEYEDFIKSVMTPYTGTIQSAIAAPELSLLVYNDAFIEVDEEDSIIRGINTTLEYAKSVIYGPWVSLLETNYDKTFYALIWQYLFASILRTRVKNIKTSRAHSFYVWEHLSGQGISNYEDVLSRTKALWLYRNISYIHANQGSNQTLHALANNLLNNSAIVLVNKTLKQNIPSLNDEPTVWVPEISSEPIIADREIMNDLPETIEKTYSELQILGLYPQGDIDIDKLRKKFAGTSHNELPTKLIELQTLPFQEKYKERVYRHLLDSWMSDIVKGRWVVTEYSTPIDFGNGYITSFKARDALSVMYYIEATLRDMTFTNVPHGTGINSLTYRDGPYQIPSTVVFDGVTQYPTTTIEFIDYLKSHDLSSGGPFKTPSAYMSDMYRRVSDDITLYNVYRTNSDGMHRRIMRHVWNAAALQVAPVTGTLVAYADWFAAHPELKLIIDDVLTRSRAEIDNITTMLMKTFLPIVGSGLEKFLPVETQEDVYRRLKELFISLCSYTVIFQDTPAAGSDWVPMTDPTLETSVNDVTMVGYIDSSKVTVTSSLNSSCDATVLINQTAEIYCNTTHVSTTYVDMFGPSVDVSHVTINAFVNCDMKDI